MRHSKGLSLVTVAAVALSTILLGCNNAANAGAKCSEAKWQSVNPPDRPILIGADYYPEHWPRDRWETDLKLMKEAGFKNCCI